MKAVRITIFTVHLITNLISGTSMGAASAWEIVEKEGELRVANGKITVELKPPSQE